MASATWGASCRGIASPASQFGTAGAGRFSSSPAWHSCQASQRPSYFGTRDACERPALPLTELAADVGLGVRVTRVLEDLSRLAEFYEIAGPAALGCVDVHERGAVRHALGLLQVVGDDGDRVPRTQFDH